MEQRRPDESMSLLVDLMTTGALDEGYAIAAARRNQPDSQPARGAAATQRGRWGSVAVLVVVGLLLAVAVSQLRSSQPGLVKAKDALRARIASGDKQVARLSREVDAARADAAALRDRALGGQSSALIEAELGAGLMPVRGPGVEVSLNDAPGSADDPFGSDENRATGGGRVLDRDIQRVVNALWAAGAEAVSVADIRLTAASAIRSAGDAVLVDYRPISPPYLIRAIGNPKTLEADFTDSPAARSLSTLHSLLGLRFTVSAAKDLNLPAATGALSLRYATPEEAK